MRAFCFVTTTALLLSTLAACSNGSGSNESSAGIPGATRNEGASSGNPGGSSGSSGARAPSVEANACVGVATAAPTCAPATNVETADLAFAIIERLGVVVDSTTDPDSGKSLIPSTDVHFTKAVTLEAAAFEPRAAGCPSDGNESNAKCFGYSFAPEKTFHTTQNPIGGRKLGTTYPAGVSCAAPSTTSDGCERIEIAEGTKVRFQRVHERFAFGSVDRYYVRIVRPCDAPCVANETRCAASTTCLSTTAGFCELCEGESLSVCACRAACVPKPEGAACSAMLSDDHGMSGTCASGKCTRK